jgi:branched-subunit amino acid transport protein
MTALIVFAAIGVGTYLIRSSMFIALGDRTLPVWLDQAMALVGPAAIAALVASAAFTSDGRIEALPLADCWRSPRAFSSSVVPATSCTPCWWDSRRCGCSRRPVSEGSGIRFSSWRRARTAVEPRRTIRSIGAGLASRKPVCATMAA